MTKVNKKLHDERKTYDKSVLTLDNTEKSPFKQFDRWYHEAEALKSFEANAMILSTLSEEGIPQSRVVLLKEYSNQGFIFFTNYKSQKGRDIAHCPNLSLLFFYEQMQRQIRIHGTAEKISDEASEAYFKTRPLESQYGAMISQQSQFLQSQEELDVRFEEIMSSHKKPQRPEHWGGYLIKPSYFEFWQGRPNRLHNRICYSLQANAWKKGLLEP